MLCGQVPADNGGTGTTPLCRPCGIRPQQHTTQGGSLMTARTSTGRKTRKGLAVAAAALAISGTLIFPASAATAPGDVSASSYRCSGEFTNGRWYYGYYDGMTVIPSTSGVSAAGIEAQCSLVRASRDLGHAGMNPGTVDGIFGRNSQNAMREFQRWVNRTFGAGSVAEDGLPGPESWPYLRRFF